MSGFTKEEKLLDLIGKIKTFICDDKDFDDDDWKGLEQIKEMIQKPEVTEEWYEEKAKEAWLLGNRSNAIWNYKNFIRSLVEEILGK